MDGIEFRLRIQQYECLPSICIGGEKLGNNKLKSRVDKPSIKIFQSEDSNFSSGWGPFTRLFVVKLQWKLKSICV